ncbi:MAG TPA: MBL fold metallo-hydrolase, partial [Solirubrobacterales bacterium]|nr:MBL fold metallo-hydrolase [Solirubrobacterales bacterium]
MEINYIGHSTVELVDGDTRILIDPFLKPNNPAAQVTAEEVEPTHVLMTHAHVDHAADAVAVGKRTGASFVAQA